MQWLSSISDFWQYDFLIWSLLGTIALAVICGLYSPLIVARKYSFMGESISHSTLLGTALSVTVLGASSPLQIYLYTLGITMGLAFFLARATYNSQGPSDSLMGIYLTTTLALGVILFQNFSERSIDLLSLLFGNILLLTVQDLIILAVLGLFSLLTFLYYFPKWIFMTYDPLGAKVSGLSVRSFHYILFAILTLIIVSSIKISGTLLVSALLLIPGSVALQFASGVKKVFMLSLGFSLVFSVLGLLAANALDLPAGACLAISQFCGLILFKLFKQILPTRLKE